MAWKAQQQNGRHPKKRSQVAHQKWVGLFLWDCRREGLHHCKLWISGPYSVELDICHDHGAMGCNGYHWITIGYQEPDGCVTWAAFTSMTDIMVPFSRLSWWEQLMRGCGQMFKSLTKPKPYKTNTKSNKTRKHPKFDRLPHFMVMSS